MNRKEAIQEYKERKPHRGAFAVRFPASGKVWVGSSPNLRAAENGLRFTLRAGLHRETTLQQEWDALGETEFQFEILEELDEDVLEMAVRDLLKEKKADWARRLSAPALL